MYDFNNFYIATVADWTLCELPDRPPDFVSYSGSAYWYYGNRVRRWSDHWGQNIASCCWYIEYHTFSGKNSICGECFYENFRPIESIISI